MPLKSWCDGALCNYRRVPDREFRAGGNYGLAPQGVLMADVKQLAIDVLMAEKERLEKQLEVIKQKLRSLIK